MRLNAAVSWPISSLGDDIDGSIELARLDVARALQQQPDRARNPAADQAANSNPKIAASAVTMTVIQMARC